MYRIIILMISTLLTWQGIYAQMKNRPQWSYGYFEDFQNSYIEVITAIGFDIADARVKATETLVVRRGMATGATNANVEINGSNIVVISETNSLIKARIVDEYFEKIDYGRYQAYLLIQTAKNPSLSFDPIIFTDKYPFSAHVFVPGMAQIYKGSIGKGSTIIAGELLFTGGVVATECLRRYNMHQMNSTYDNSLKQQYEYNAHICSISRNICIAGIAAVYVWNLIDGIVAKGNKRIFVGDLAHLRVLPYADSESGGVAAVVNF